MLARLTGSREPLKEQPPPEQPLAMVSAAKNNLRQKHGYSPAQWLFGAEPRLGDAMFDEDLYYKEELRSPDEIWRRRQTIQLAAFLQTQAGTPLRRALLGQPRSNAEVYEQGDYVYIYRVHKTAGGKARKRQNAGEWIAPGVVVGREGSSYWLSPIEWCVLCAAEHLRPAESEELGLAFQSFFIPNETGKGRSYASGASFGQQR